MVSHRFAQEKDCTKLSRLAFDSEKYWDYDLEYMNQFEKQYCITKEYIQKNQVVVLEDHFQIVGFFSLVLSNSNWELEYFYIRAKSIKNGYGRILWQEVIHFCKENSIQTFHLVTSPQAVGFYEKMGASVIGETSSSLNSKRKIPVLQYIVP